MKKIALLITLIFITTFFALPQTKLVHYLLPEFKPGIVLMKNGVMNEVIINYNLVTEEMVFYQGDQILALADAVLNNLDSVLVSDRKFVLNSKKKFIEVANSDNYEFYIEHKCRLLSPGKPAGYGGTSQTSAVDTYASLYNSGMWYKLEIPDDYTVKPFNVYWIDNGSGLKEIRSVRQLKRFYNKDKDLYNSYTKNNTLDFDDYESVKELVHFMASNSN